MNAGFISCLQSLRTLDWITGILDYWTPSKIEYVGLYLYFGTYVRSCAADQSWGVVGATFRKHNFESNVKMRLITTNCLF